MNAQKLYSNGSMCLTWKWYNTYAFKNFGLFLPPHKALFARFPHVTHFVEKDAINITV